MSGDGEVVSRAMGVDPRRAQEAMKTLRHQHGGNAPDHIAQRGEQLRDGSRAFGGELVWRGDLGSALKRRRRMERGSGLENTKDYM